MTSARTVPETSNWLLVSDRLHQNAAPRPLLRAGQL